jgi:exopolysaccharide production protein ExoQ
MTPWPERTMRTPARQKVPFSLHTLTCATLMLFVGTDIFSILLGGEGVGGPKFLCYMTIFGLCAAYAETFCRGLAVSTPLFLLMGLACASALWSIDRGATLERLIALVACSSIGVLVGRGHSLRGLILFIGVLATLTCWCSLLAIAGFSEARGSPPWDTTWRGIFNHKNGLGAAMAVGLPFMLHSAMISRGIMRKLFASGVMVGLILLVASESRTAQIIGILAVANLLIGLACRSRKLSWATITLILCGLAAGLVLFFFATGITDAIFSALGRKPTMSGRIPLWTLTWPYVLEHPWLGYGYSAFWAPDSDRVLLMSIDPDLRFAPFYSHNGLVETLLAVGVVGASLLVWLLYSAFRCVVRVLQQAGQVDDLIPILIFLVSFCLLNVTESSVLQRDDITWMVFAAVVVQLATLLRTVEGAREEPRRFRLKRATLQRRLNSREVPS